MTNTLVVTVKSAKNLRDADGIFSGKSDPYCRIRIVDDNDHTTDIVGTKKTKVINGGGENPEWNETFTFAGLDTPAAYTLYLNVLDKDYFTRDDPLGEARVDLGTLTHAKGGQEFRDVWIDGYIWKAYLSFSLSTRGGWGNSPGSANSLRVRVRSVEGVRDWDHFGVGKADPYVYLRVTDSAGKDVATPQRTSTKQDAGGSAAWDEEFQFERLEHPGACRLALAVYDRDTLVDENLGAATLHLGTLPCRDELVDYDGFKLSSQGTISFSVSNLGGWGFGRRAATDTCQCC